MAQAISARALPGYALVGAAAMAQEQEPSSEEELLDPPSKRAQRELARQERAQRERSGKRAEPEVASRGKAGEPVCSTRGRRWLGGQQVSSRSIAFTRILEGENQVLPDPGMLLNCRGARSPCERCGRSPRQRVTCVGGCMRRVGPGCGQENVSLRCLLLEFPRLASRRSPHCRTGICVDCISQNPGGVMSSMRYTSSGAQSTGTLL